MRQLKNDLPQTKMANKKNKGVAMGYVLILITVFVVLGTAMLMATTSNMQQTATYLEVDARYFAAESALQYMSQGFATHIAEVDLPFAHPQPGRRSYQFTSTASPLPPPAAPVGLPPNRNIPAYMGDFFFLHSSNDTNAVLANAAEANIAPQFFRDSVKYLLNLEDFNADFVEGNNAGGGMTFNRHDVEFIGIDYSNADIIQITWADPIDVTPYGPITTANRTWLHHIEEVTITLSARSAGRRLSLDYTIPFATLFEHLLPTHRHTFTAGLGIVNEDLEHPILDPAVPNYDDDGVHRDSPFPVDLNQIDGVVWQGGTGLTSAQQDWQDGLEAEVESILNAAWQDVLPDAIAMFRTPNLPANAMPYLAVFSNVVGSPTTITRLTDVPPGGTNIDVATLMNGKDYVFVNGHLEIGRGVHDFTGVRAVIVRGDIRVDTAVDGLHGDITVLGCPNYNTMFISTNSNALIAAINGDPIPVIDPAPPNVPAARLFISTINPNPGPSRVITMHNTRFVVGGNLTANFRNHSGLFGNGIFITQGSTYLNGNTNIHIGRQARQLAYPSDTMNFANFVNNIPVGAPQFYSRGPLTMNLFASATNDSFISGFFTTLGSYNNNGTSRAARTNARGLIFAPQSNSGGAAPVEALRAGLHDVYYYKPGGFEANDVPVFVPFRTIIQPGIAFAFTEDGGIGEFSGPFRITNPNNNFLIPGGRASFFSNFLAAPNAFHLAPVQANHLSGFLCFYTESAITLDNTAPNLRPTRIDDVPSNPLWREDLWAEEYIDFNGTSFIPWFSEDIEDPFIGTSVIDSTNRTRSLQVETAYHIQQPLLIQETRELEIPPGGLPSTWYTNPANWPNGYPIGPNVFWTHQTVDGWPPRDPERMRRGSCAGPNNSICECGDTCTCAVCDYIVRGYGLIRWMQEVRLGFTQYSTPEAVSTACGGCGCQICNPPATERHCIHDVANPCADYLAGLPCGFPGDYPPVPCGCAPPMPSPTRRLSWVYTRILPATLSRLRETTGL